MRSLLPVLVVLCACKPAPCQQVELLSLPRMPFATVGVEYVGVAGSSVLELGPVQNGRVTTCPEEQALVHEVVGSVVDEMNTPVESHWSFERVRRVGGIEAVARVRFTPASPGPFHFVVRFQPDIALVQGEILSAPAPVAARPTLATLDVPIQTDCSTAHLMPGGTLVCGVLNDFLDSQDVSVVHHGAVVAGISASGTGRRVTSAAVGSTLWLYAEGGVSRWQETDAGVLSRVASPAMSGTNEEHVTGATRDIAYGSDWNGGRYRWFVDAGVVQREELSRGPITAGATAVTPDGGELWFHNGMVPCLMRTEPGDAGDRCFTDAVFLNAHFEPEGAWFRTFNRKLLGHLTADGTVASADIPEGFEVNGPLVWLPDAGDGVAPQLFLAVTGGAADAGLRLERIEGAWDYGVADGENLLLRSGTKVHVMRR